MIRGIYTAASGMLAESARTDTIANNLANVNTAGYKKDVAITKDFASMLIYRINDGAAAPSIGSLGVGAMVDEIATIHSTGMMRQTGNALDLAIDGNGYFAVQTPAGVRYTKNGTFTKNAQGQIVTQDGNPVMGTAGPITVNNAASNLTVSPDGRVMLDGVEAGQLSIVEFANEKQLLKEGDSLYNANGAQARPSGSRVEQGMLEQSNVNVVAEMVNLITGYRAYEVNAKTVQAHDQLLDKAVNEVGRT
jgi:flagellar basal-body rod protein FlgG